jgi:hypothetical protein
MIRATSIFQNLALACAVPAVVLLISRPGNASAGEPAVTQVVHVTIFGNTPATCTSCPGRIVLSRKTVRRGTVTFKITNRSDDFAVFEIKSVDSRKMGPNGGQAIVKVTFKKPGLYSATVPSYYSGTTGGLLRVT